MSRQQSDTIYINFPDQFIPPKTQALMGAITEIINQRKPSTVYLCLSYPGGMIADAIAVYNFLRALPVRLITHNIGSLDAVQTAVFLAGEERYASPTARFVFHGILTPIPGPVTLTALQLRALLDDLNNDENSILTLMKSRTQLTEPELREVFRNRETISLDVAKDKALINDVRELAIPAGASIASLSF